SRRLRYAPTALFPLSCSLTRLPLTASRSPYTTLFRSTARPSFVRADRRNIHAGVDGSERGAYHRTESFSRRRTRGLVARPRVARSEEHTSELQSRENLVCRLLLAKKNTNATTASAAPY